MQKMKRVLVATVMALCASVTASAQAPAPSVEAMVARAQQRAEQGDSVGARSVLDSLLAAHIDAPARAEATYWLTQFAATPADRERGLTMFVIDYPFSPRASSALYELAVLELAHNDRDRAVTHLSRFLAEGAKDSNRVSASLTLGRLLFDRGEASRACAVLLSGRTEVPSTAVELRNQFDFAAGPCRGVDTSVVVPVPAPRDTAPLKDTFTKPIGEYTVQVAAYDTKAQGDRLATRLRGMGYEARVVGKKKPFRVRVGHYLTHAQADAAARKIDALTKMKPFVTVIGPEEG
jgi:cell division septation protein DedD